MKLALGTDALLTSPENQTRLLRMVMTPWTTGALVSMSIRKRGLQLGKGLRESAGP